MGKWGGVAEIVVDREGWANWGGKERAGEMVSEEEVGGGESGRMCERGYLEKKLGRGVMGRGGAVEGLI